MDILRPSHEKIVYVRMSRMVLNQFAKSCSIVIFHRTEYRTWQAAEELYFFGNFVESLRNFSGSTGFRSETVGKAPTS
jgi:hypothetical protein